MEKLEFAEVSDEEAQQTLYPYVYVEDNGAFRELTENEKEYLQEKHHPSDGDRPYIKSRYGSKTPDGKMRGFCKRAALPKYLIAGKTPQKRKWWKLW